MSISLILSPLGAVARQILHLRGLVREPRLVSARGRRVHRHVIAFELLQNEREVVPLEPRWRQLAQVRPHHGDQEAPRGLRPTHPYCHQKTRDKVYI